MSSSPQTTFPASSRLHSALTALLDSRKHPKTLCPSEVPRSLSSAELEELDVSDWRDLMEATRAIVWEMREHGEVEVLQRGKILEAAVSSGEVKGPVRVVLLAGGVPKPEQDVSYLNTAPADYGAVNKSAPTSSIRHGLVNFDSGFNIASAPDRTKPYIKLQEAIKRSMIDGPEWLGNATISEPLRNLLGKAANRCGVRRRVPTYRPGASLLFSVQ
ncbi:MAG: hypothetical protein M1837_000118 [Sclerophora amabilis]|nr:MAG: hypothetical protein M1837_000118 [Sclerophora amabilis]